MVGLSNDCKCVFHELSLTLWCHAAVLFVVKMSCFFKPLYKRIVLNVEDHCQCIKRPLRCRPFFFYSDFLCVEQEGTQLGPSRKS